MHSEKIQKRHWNKTNQNFIAIFLLKKMAVRTAVLEWRIT